MLLKRIVNAVSILWTKRGSEEQEEKFSTSEKVYDSIDTLPIWNYDRILNTGDLRCLLILKKYDNLPDLDIEQLAPIYEEITYQKIDEFGLDEFQQLIIYKEKSKDYLQTQFILINSLLISMQLGEFRSSDYMESFDQLRELGVKSMKLIRTDHYKEAIDNELNRNRSKITRLRIFARELSEMQKSDSKPISLTKQRLMIQSKFHEKINVYTCPVKEWFTWINMYNESKSNEN